ncbi:hypothetical protein AUP68_10988 [Ilyonectria robusta]
MTTQRDDINDTLLDITRYHGKSIVSLMLDIQKSTLAQDKKLSIIKNLECLRPASDQSFLLSRHWINAIEDHDYVALSYTWDSSNDEDRKVGGYMVQTRDRAREFRSPVRDCVFDRIIKYMRRFQLNLLWIDRHTIKQRSCNQTPCIHPHCNQKRHALQAMDLIYKLSNHPVALLQRCFHSRFDMMLLARILGGELVTQHRQAPRFRLSEKTSRQEAGNALTLLKDITSDLWWTRTWTFQESYRAGTAMHLLIPHVPALERQKRSSFINLFSDINEELCINSVSFSYEATRLCLAFEGIQPQTPAEREAIGHVLTTAGRYTITLKKHESMTPTIISDIEHRNVKKPWDRLAVVANCCQYPVRLDVEELQRKKHSLSLSMLVMSLLNGEILSNGRSCESPSQMTVSKFLKAQSFKGFYSPLNRRSLSFNKGCRFPHVRLTPDGIFTKGHLWKLGRAITSHDVDEQTAWVDNSTGKLTLRERKRLTQLANTLRSLGYSLIERRIRRCLSLDSERDQGYFDNESYSERYMRMMGSELVDAIDSGMTLRLGSLWDPSGQPSPYRAVFICDGGDGVGQSQGSESVLIFTAFRPKFQGSNGNDTNDVDRHVSLEVQHKGCVEDAGNIVPRLYTKGWRLGLCYFERSPRVDVVFPWPAGLETMTSGLH